MTAQTPIKQFVRLNDLFFVEDFAGMRMPIAMCADEGQADWLAYTLERAHSRPVVSWNEVMPTSADSGAGPGDAYPEPMRSLINEGAVGELKEDKAPDGAPWYAHLDGPCGPTCSAHKPEEGGGDGLEAVHRPE